MLKACPCCDNVNITDLSGQLYECAACDHIFQNPPNITAQYDQQYVDDRYEKYSTTGTMSGIRLGLVSTVLDNGTLLDVGYGNGAFVKLAQKAGYDAYGNDIHGADYGVREKPLNSSDLWDVVTFFDSLEHFPDLNLVRPLVARTRYIVISIPKRPAFFPGDRDWRHYRPGEHLHFFSLKSLSAFFKKRPLLETRVEDAIRGKIVKHGNEYQNIETIIFA